MNLSAPEPAIERDPRPARQVLPWLAIAAFIAIGVARIVSTYPVFNEVFDEAPHIAGGMEWWQFGTYNYERKHTPLARIAVAAPLYLRGLRGKNLPAMSDEGHLVLYSNNEYYKNLAWARAGNLPFYILSCILLALWAKRWWGPWTAVAAVGLFSALPPILGHAAVATTDMAAVFGTVASAFTFCLWLEKPDAKRAALFGVAGALALLGKLSVLPFFGIGAVMTLGWLAWRRVPVGILAPVPFSIQARNLALTVAIAIVIIWAPYHFRFAALSTGHGYRPPAASMGRMGPIVDRILDAKIPLGEFFGGVASVMTANKIGYMSFLNGEYRNFGWWYFFPIVLAIKTPLSFLLLALSGIHLAVKRLGSSAEWQRGVPLLFAIGILASAMMATLNFGVRHILPIYPMLALVGAPVLVWLVSNARSRRWAGIVAALAICAFGGESALPHPDYMASFNLLAGSKPEKIVVGSDIDWGQDLKRLSNRLKELKVPSLSLLYSGGADVNRFGLPPFVQFGPGDNPTGWVAVSMTRMMLDCAKDHNYCSWQYRTPVERVGRSIYLFYVPPAR